MLALMRLYRSLIILFYFPLTLSSKREVDALTNLRVIQRWSKTLSVSDITQRLLEGETLTKKHCVLIAETFEKWRGRLENIS